MTYDGSAMMRAERRADKRREEKKQAIKQGILLFITSMVLGFVGIIYVFGTMSEETYQNILHRHERSK